MDLRREQLLNEILGRALERPAAERRAFLEEACGGDAGLLDEALAYLGHESEITGFLEQPILATPAAARPEDRHVAPDDATPGETPVTADHDPTRRVGPYRILDRLGAGAMGEVYRAEDTRLGRVVALKFLRRELTGRLRAKSRFLREASAAAKLDHPNVCTVHEIGETDDGQLYIVMACYEGESLKERLKRGPLPVPEAARIARQIAAGLARAHREGVVHRDVKPANVFLTRGEAGVPGAVKVLDFGVAKVSGETALTGTGGVVGTLNYMAPEQIFGDPDHRSDIWGLGVVLYEMLFGERPFSGQQVVKAIVQDPVPRLDEKRPDVPDALRRILRRALAKDPDERYQSAGELAADLPATVDGSVDGLPVPTAVMRSVRARSRRTRRRLAAAVAAAVALALGGFYWAGRGAGGTEAPAGVTAANVVAILPFTVRGGDDFAYLGEGMVDLLSAKLDGAGNVRAVPPRVLLQRLADEPAGVDGPAAGARFARRLGASLLVLGNVVEVAGQLQIDAALYRTAGGVSEVARATAEGTASGIFSLVDGLAVQLLAELDRGAATRMGRLAARTTESFPALKLYLEGEGAWRAGRFNDAARSFEAAVTEDPEFALAWYRLSIARNWLFDPQGAVAALEQAGAHAARLAPDDRRLIEAVNAYNQGDAVTAERLCREILSRRPEDIEAWTALGEVGFHLGPLVGRSLRHSRRAWQHVVAIEPDDRQAQVHLARLDLYERRLDDLARRSERLETLLADSTRVAEPRLLLAMIAADGSAERTRGLDLLLGTELGVSWLTAGFTLSAPEARDFWGSFYEALLASARPPREQTFAHRRLALLALAAGRLAEAEAHFAAATHPPEKEVGYRALAATVPFLPASAERLRALIAEVEAWPTESAAPFAIFEPHTLVPAHRRLYVLALLVARAGDTERALSLADELAALGEAAGFAGLDRDLELGVRADVAFRAGRYEEVVDLLAERHGRYAYELTLASPIFSQSRERYLKAESLHRLGRLEEALAWYETLGEVDDFDVVYLAVSHRRRAEILRRLERPELAAEHERLAAELWREADPELAEKLP